MILSIRFLLRWFTRALLIIVGAAALYGGTAVLLALLPVARTAPSGPAGPVTRIYVVSNGFHTDVVVPMDAAWRDALRPGFPFVDPAIAPYVAFGWGDRDFYMTTPGVGDIRAGLALQALFWSPASVMHVTLWGGPPLPSEDVRVIDLAPAQLAVVTQGLMAGFARDSAGAFRPLSQGAYTATDAFFAAVGGYSVILTCNEWAAALLRPAGVAVPAWSPFAFGLTWRQ